MRMKAAAYSQYGDAAVISLVLEALPQVGSWDYDGLLISFAFIQIAAEVASPLSKTGEIVLIGGSDTVGQEVIKLIGTLPQAVRALTGVYISGVNRIN